MLYDYDKAGNITVKSKLAYTTGTAYIVDGAITAYGYSSSEWKDRLTSYGGTAISYDSLGNPTNWRGGITDICWDGKKLTTLSKDIFGISMSYNADGIRTRKYCVEQPTLSSVLHQYTLDGTKILKETVTGTKSYTNYYFYDENGSIAGLEYNGVLYYFQKNIQGDIIRICNANGVIVTEYTYDAWGKLLSTTGSLASTVGARNPFRYRGYYYDDETGLYYVSSRYYDPEVGRFVNADGELAGVGESVQGYNLFAYCHNNPVNMSDPDGNWPRWATIALGVVAAVAAVAVTVATLGAAAPAAACTLTMVGMSIGASYAVASTVAAVAVTATVAAAAVYAGDIAYSAVTGDSPLKDTVFQGNEDAYNTGLVFTSIATGGMLELAAQSPGVCFVAGTAVLTSAGYVAIEDIKTGDKVWSEDPKTGEKEIKKVVQTFVNETDELVHVFANGEEIVTTPEHPFYVPTKGWTGAIHLRAGDILVLQNGKYAIVEKTQHELLESPVKVYNFEVADFHTYFVGDSSILVHNVCGAKSALSKNGTKLNSTDALDLADDFLGKGYTEMSPGRFVSSDGLRQVRMGNSDILGLHGGGPHINFDVLSPNYKSVHVYIFD